MPSWRYFESGVSGWTEVTSPSIPNPNASPINTPRESTREEGVLADGRTYYIYPENRMRRLPVKFTWNFQSGAAPIVSKFEDWMTPKKSLTGKKTI